jgi:hypothetical protein
VISRRKFLKSSSEGEVDADAYVDLVSILTRGDAGRFEYIPRRSTGRRQSQRSAGDLLSNVLAKWH